MERLMVMEELRYADGAMSVVLIGLTFHYGDLFKPTSHADNLDSVACFVNIQDAINNFCRCYYSTNALWWGYHSNHNYYM